MCKKISEILLTLLPAEPINIKATLFKKPAVGIQEISVCISWPANDHSAELVYRALTEPAHDSEAAPFWYPHIDIWQVWVTQNSVCAPKTMAGQFRPFGPKTM